MYTKLWLWLRSSANVLLLKGRWFDFPGLNVKVSLGKKITLNCS